MTGAAHSYQALAIPPQGPMGAPGIGIQGDPGPSGSAGTNLTSDIAISGHKVLARTATGLENASCDNPVHASTVIGVSLNAAAPGDPITVISYGEITEPSWNWTPLLPVFLGLNGLLTQIPPTTSGLFSLIIGFAVSAHVLFVSLGVPMTLI